MKLWISMLLIIISIFGLCLWDSIHSSNIFNTLEEKSNYINTTLQNTEISNKDLQNEILELNHFWTKKMDTLSISISRKDLQPVSDYLQYLCASIKNNNQEDAITYSRLLNYNILGLKESYHLSWTNLL